MSGWIKINRDLSNHWIWQNSDYLKWWLDMLIEVNHTPSKVNIKNIIYECNRGEKLYSLDTWAKRWNTNKSKVRRFFELLQDEGMIVVKSETQTTRVTICNYDSYQSNDDGVETQMKRKRNANETHLTPIQERKERKEYITSNNTGFSKPDEIDWNGLISFFNKVTGKKTRVVGSKAKRQFKKRLDEGFKKEDIISAIKNCFNDPYHKKNPHYLTLEFISREDKLAKYSDYKKAEVKLPDDWFFRELTQEQKEILPPEKLKSWNLNKMKTELEGGKLRPIER
jgi:uncharacterized phage protein (TIGR02220 family)